MASKVVSKVGSSKIIINYTYWYSGELFMINFSCELLKAIIKTALTAKGRSISWHKRRHQKMFDNSRWGCFNFRFVSLRIGERDIVQSEIIFIRHKPIRSWEKWRKCRWRAATKNTNSSTIHRWSEFQKWSSLDQSEESIAESVPNPSTTTTSTIHNNEPINAYATSNDAYATKEIHHFHSQKESCEQLTSNSKVFKNWIFE